jgi:hypothetical protein
MNGGFNGQFIYGWGINHGLMEKPQILALKILSQKPPFMLDVGFDRM